jgi:hypothetical protein
MSRRWWPTAVSLVLSVFFFFRILVVIGIMVFWERPSEKNTVEMTAVIVSIDTASPRLGEAGNTIIIYIERHGWSNETSRLIVFSDSLLSDTDVIGSLQPGQIIFYRSRYHWIDLYLGKGSTSVAALRIPEKELVTTDSYNKYWDRRELTGLFGCLSGMIISLSVYYYREHHRRQTGYLKPIGNDLKGDTATGGLFEVTKNENSISDFSQHHTESPEIRFQSSYTVTLESYREYYRVVRLNKMIAAVICQFLALKILHCMIVYYKAKVITYNDLFAGLPLIVVVLVVLVCANYWYTTRDFRRVIKTVGDTGFNMVTSATDSDVERHNADPVNTVSSGTGMPTGIVMPIKSITNIYRTKNYIILTSKEHSFVFAVHRFTRGTPDELMAFLKSRGLRFRRV